MQRSELEHAIRAATEIVQCDSVIVIGSQSILGSRPEWELPEVVTLSEEVDIVPINDDDAESLATKLDAVAGEWSTFHQTHGFYIQGVGKRTAVLPTGWNDRLVPVRTPATNGRVGLCLDIADLCIAKLVAHREKDLVFVSALINEGITHPAALRTRAEMLPDSVDERSRLSVLSWIEAQSTAKRD